MTENGKAHPTYSAEIIRTSKLTADLDEFTVRVLGPRGGDYTAFVVRGDAGPVVVARVERHGRRVSYTRSEGVRAAAMLAVKGAA